jgi:hypothetical protein
MKKITLLFAIIILFSIHLCFSQNLIPNPSFEFGNKLSGVGCTYSPNSYNKGIKYFNDDIDNCNNSCPGHFLWNYTIFKEPTNTSDWLWKSNCLNCSFPVPYSEKFIHMKGNDEGVLTKLNSNLIPGKRYVLRIKMASNYTNVDLHVWFTKWHETKNFSKCWAYEKYLGQKNQRWIDPVIFKYNAYDDPNFPYFCPTHLSDVQEPWLFLEMVLPPVPDDLDELGTIVLFPTDGNAYIDYVELTEWCPNEMRIENTAYYLKEPPYEAGYIYAGFDAGTPTPNGNVVVKDGADITYKAEYKVELLPGFEVEEGAEFLAYIAPCGSLCPTLPDIFAGDDACINTPTPIGCQVSTRENEYFYWVAEPANAISYLSDPNISNPIFTPPSGCGKIKYTLFIKNECDEIKQDEIQITYDSSPETPWVNATITTNPQTDNYLELDIAMSTHTEICEIQIYESLSGNLVHTDYIHPNCCGQSSCNYHWKYPFFLDFCKDYQVKIKSKNLCVDYWSSITTLDFQRSLCTNIHLDFINNVIIINSATNHCLSIKTSCADTYDIEIKNRNGRTIYLSSGNIVSDPQCIWYPNSNLANAVYFYILKLDNCFGDHMEYNGVIHLLPNSSKTTDIQLKTVASLRAYPNPFSDKIQISIELPSESKDCSLEIFNASGVLIDEIFINKNLPSGINRFVYSSNTLKSGIYFLRFRSSEFLLNAKILKQ